MAMLIGAFGVWVAYKTHFFVERRFKIDDAVGAVAVHGYARFLRVCVAGFVLWGYPSSPNPEFARITPWGQFAGACIMFWVLGFLPTYVLTRILKAFGTLRIPREIGLVGLDLAEYHGRYLDETGDGGGRAPGGPRDRAALIEPPPLYQWRTSRC